MFWNSKALFLINLFASFDNNLTETWILAADNWKLLSSFIQRKKLIVMQIYKTKLWILFIFLLKKTEAKRDLLLLM